MAEATKTCVYCKESMKKSATVCPHCTKHQPGWPTLIGVGFCVFLVIWALVLLPAWHALFG